MDALEPQNQIERARAQDYVAEPPQGFEPFEVRHRKVEPGHYVPICPHCKAPKQPGDEWGFTREETHFQDPGAQAAYDQAKAEGRPISGKDPQIYEDVPLLLHWSRYATNECKECGSEFWHDFRVEGWRYFYRPPRVQLQLIPETQEKA